ncbi:RNA methyltransferase [Flavobacteriaceae bacterium S356]|uniref:RNA methyltransferase n=1 Tax=Asprobacillus argus TaxID=3076534 RepID=A0ABU3LFK7_9FLAO|nr:RNA methyltransferase [Flavobacteriaceae bacterium S356]
MSLSKNHTKLITSLRQKKYRQKHKMFVVEGVKVVQEFLQSSFQLHLLFTTDTSYEDHANVVPISEVELKKISHLITPNKVLAVFMIPEAHESKSSGLILALDAINDPGNLGTIIRLCDWFGVTQIICSNDTVDCYNSKVVQASMGSLTRISMNYVDLDVFLKETNLPIFIADMEGENVYTSKLPKTGILVMGNEANGISEEIRNVSNHILTIPRFGDVQQTESLNVATATAILLSEFRR